MSDDRSKERPRLIPINGDDPLRLVIKQEEVEAARNRLVQQLDQLSLDVAMVRDGDSAFHEYLARKLFGDKGTIVGADRQDNTRTRSSPETGLDARPFGISSVDGGAENASERSAPRISIEEFSCFTIGFFKSQKREAIHKFTLRDAFQKRGHYRDDKQQGITAALARMQSLGLLTWKSGSHNPLIELVLPAADAYYDMLVGTSKKSLTIDERRALHRKDLWLGPPLAKED